MLEISNIISSCKDSSKPLVSKVLDDMLAITGFFERIIGHLEERCDGKDSDSIESAKEFGLSHSGAGRLLPLGCGHSGCLSEEEKLHLERHLLGSNMIN